MRLRYVVADDAAFIREILKNILKKMGHECVGEAEDGEAAINLVASTLPDIIFVDMVMPQKSGLSVIKNIRNQHPEIKIVSCSTLDDQETITKAIALGTDFYLTKPFTVIQIEEVISKLFYKSTEVVK